jgi:NADH:ubiquinone oxidoreductase subunit
MIDMMGFILRLLTWWREPTIGTALFTWRKGELVGTDAQENRYFRERNGDRRWVMYNGDVEASRVPPEWDAWLHYTVNSPPSESPPEVKPWEQDHEANLTGTSGAYHPAGSLERGGLRAPATGDYEAWRPEG